MRLGVLVLQGRLVYCGLGSVAMTTTTTTLQALVGVRNSCKVTTLVMRVEIAENSPPLTGMTAKRIKTPHKKSIDIFFAYINSSCKL